MDGQQAAWAVPDWWNRYQAQEGNFSSIDDGTLGFLSQSFGGLPLVLLLPVDYTMPPAPVVPGVPCVAVPPAPLPEARAHQAPDQAEGPTLQQLQAVLGGTAASTEAELAELAAWLGSAPAVIQAGPPAAAPRALPFGAIGQPLPPPPQQLPRPGPALSIYCDAAALAAPAAAPALVPMVPALAPTPPPVPRPQPLADMTNRQAAGPAASGSKTLRQISSKLHVAASKKIQPQLPEEEVKALVQQQLRATEPSRAPWFRSGLQSSANRFRGATKAVAAPAQSQAPAATGIPACTGTAAFPGTGVYMPRA
ncbi:hypothetical protein ABPG75_006069 [Micractinium tetrahymenae]